MATNVFNFIMCLYTDNSCVASTLVAKLSQKLQLSSVAVVINFELTESVSLPYCDEICRVGLYLLYTL